MQNISRDKNYLGHFFYLLEFTNMSRPSTCGRFCNISRNLESGSGSPFLKGTVPLGVALHTRLEFVR